MKTFTFLSAINGYFSFIKDAIKAFLSPDKLLHFSVGLNIMLIFDKVGFQLPSSFIVCFFIPIIWEIGQRLIQKKKFEILDVFSSELGIIVGFIINTLFQ